MTGQHIAAIHTLKAKLRLSDDDYRALLLSLTGIDSTKLMTSGQRQAVRDHMQALASQLGVVAPRRRATPKSFAERKAEASPRERKVWALWGQLHRDGVVHDGSARALGAWTQRMVRVASPRWCTAEQLDTLIEALKDWQRRGVSPAPASVPVAQQATRGARG